MRQAGLSTTTSHHHHNPYVLSLLLCCACGMRPRPTTGTRMVSKRRVRFQKGRWMCCRCRTRVMPVPQRPRRSVLRMPPEHPWPVERQRWQCSRCDALWNARRWITRVMACAVSQARTGGCAQSVRTTLSAPRRACSPRRLAGQAVWVTTSHTHPTNRFRISRPFSWGTFPTRDTLTSYNWDIGGA